MESGRQLRFLGSRHVHRLGQKRGLANLAKQWFYNITFPETRPQNSHPEHARNAVISLGGRRVSGTVGHPQLQLLAGLHPTRRCVDRSWCGFEIMFFIRAPVVEAHQRTRRVVGINTDCEGGFMCPQCTRKRAFCRSPRPNFRTSALRVPTIPDEIIFVRNEPFGKVALCPERGGVSGMSDHTLRPDTHKGKNSETAGCTAPQHNTQDWRAHRVCRRAHADRQHVVNPVHVSCSCLPTLLHSRRTSRDGVRVTDDSQLATSRHLLARSSFEFPNPKAVTASCCEVPLGNMCRGDGQK